MFVGAVCTPVKILCMVDKRLIAETQGLSQYAKELPASKNVGEMRKNSARCRELASVAVGTGVK